MFPGGGNDAAPPEEEGEEGHGKVDWDDGQLGALDVAIEFTKPSLPHHRASWPQPSALQSARAAPKRARRAEAKSEDEALLSTEGHSGGEGGEGEEEQRSRSSAFQQLSCE